MHCALCRQWLLSGQIRGWTPGDPTGPKKRGPTKRVCEWACLSCKNCCVIRISLAPRCEFLGCDNSMITSAWLRGHLRMFSLKISYLLGKRKGIYFFQKLKKTNFNVVQLTKIHVMLSLCLARPFNVSMLHTIYCKTAMFPNRICQEFLWVLAKFLEGVFGVSWRTEEFLSSVYWGLWGSIELKATFKKD